MRVLLLTLALCCLVHHATPQTLIKSMNVDGVIFHIYGAIGTVSLTVDHPCPGTEHLAVFESEEEYKALIEDMGAEGVTAPSEILIGLGKTNPNPDGDAIIRTYTGKRPAPYVNFEVGTTSTLLASQCAYMKYDPTTPLPDFLDSPWNLGDLELLDGELFMCMARTDAACVGDDCFDTRMNDRVGKSCFWNPYNRTLLAWYEAKEVCYEHGGHLMDLIDAADITRIKEWSDKYPSWADLWLGLTQKPGKGHPTWSKGAQVDEQAAWETDIHYGSSSNYFPYAGIWHVATKGMNLYEIADGDSATEVKAFAACEATQEKFCKYSSKDVKYADKSVCCDDEKLWYTCKSGWMFPDGDYKKSIDCGCDVDFDDDDHHIPDCILKNPCKHDAYLCGPHGECIFTNQKEKPYYCNCEAGYRWDDAGHHCVDETTPTRPPIVAVHTMTIYFNVNMNYDAAMNDPDDEAHEKFEEALEELTRYVYREEGITVDSFYIDEESYGKMKVKVVFNLYISADVTTVSKYVWKFYSYIKNAEYFMVNNNPYPYSGSVYFKSSSISREIPITSVCSIFDDIQQCHGSYCHPDGYTPKCRCNPGSYGMFCNDQPAPHQGPDLNDTEIGLIIAVCILFLMVICMPFCLLCCIMHCRWFRPRRHTRHHGHEQEHEHYTNNAYSHTPTYVSKVPQVATRYPKFRIM